MDREDLIRMAGHARHYLAVFGDHHQQALYPGRAKRCATTAQRLAVFARDIGCTRPGCPEPAFDCEAHHGDEDFAAGGNTNIDELAVACACDHALLDDTEWTTRRRATVTPNGYPHPASTPAKPASTTTTTPTAIFEPKRTAMTMKANRAVPQLLTS